METAREFTLTKHPHLWGKHHNGGDIVAAMEEYAEMVVKNISFNPPVSRPYSPAVAKQLLCIKDALIRGDKDLAYHHLYLIASPMIDKLSDDVWTEMEQIAGEYVG